MPTNTKEYMREYARQRRAGIKKPIVKTEKNKENVKERKLTKNEKEFLKKLIIKSTHRRSITQEESEKALDILYK